VVNLLEALYVITALSFLMALVTLARGRRRRAGQFALLAAVGTVLSIVFYWYLSPPT